VYLSRSFVLTQRRAKRGRLLSVSSFRRLLSVLPPEMEAIDSGGDINRIMFHLVSSFERQDLNEFRRGELQNVLDTKKQQGLSFSVVDHLRCSHT